VITEGASPPLAGESRAIAGHARDRYVYAPVDGVFRTNAQIGDVVRAGESLAKIDATVLTALCLRLQRPITADYVRLTRPTDGATAVGGG
jgi:xanthine dehydrogenase accessory factor